MGSDNGASDEQPVHTVHLDAFYVDKYEVTNALYKACADAGVCQLPKDTSSKARSNYYGNPEFDDYPVIYVDWNMAKIYCETWRGAHLPTEAEWEKAARGTDGRTYPWGEDSGGEGSECSKANYYEDCATDTTKVGSYESGKSIYGAYDMAGNVLEWVADWYSETYYQTSPSANPLGPDSGQYRVLRGGSFSTKNDVNLRSAARSSSPPSVSLWNIGFRCARSIP